jgi:hypothetical protein
MKCFLALVRKEHFMALSGSFGFTNTTASSVDITPTAVGMSNYAVTVDDPGKCVLKNTTCPIDQVETITFMCQDLNTINQEEKNVHPPKLGGGRLITAKIEAKKRFTSTVDDTFMVDYPVSCNISWRFSKTQYVDATDLMTMLKRVLGALQDASSDGYLIDNLMMQDLNPKS